MVSEVKFFIPTWFFETQEKKLLKSFHPLIKYQATINMELATISESLYAMIYRQNSKGGRKTRASVL